MRVGFDFDGVIAKIDLDYYKTLINEELIEEYYRKMMPLYNPYNFLGPGDKGYIITGRLVDFEIVTQEWLKKHSIHLPLYITGRANGGHQDWSTENWINSTQLKADKINELGVEVFLEDQLTIVKLLRLMCPRTRIVNIK